MLQRLLSLFHSTFFEIQWHDTHAWSKQVESAFEFARICRKLDYHNFVFSMKASNPIIMVQAYRLLVAEMYVQGWDYPLHLGVTEAGEGEDGRMKSAIGIGTLLQVPFFF